jgi:ABC-type transporter MlaC component
MLPRDGRWWVYDIVVDDASQLQTYRRSFSKILDKEGWDGLIKRMQRSAGVAS